MSYTYRCGSCKRQKTFKKPLEDGKNKCPSCANGNFHRFKREPTELEYAERYGYGPV